MNKAHCYWSHRFVDRADLRSVVVNGEEALVLPEYKPKLEGFLSFSKQCFRSALSLILLSAVLIVIAVLTRVSWLSDAALVLLGATLVVFPFATSTTYDLMGVRTATLVVRVAGLAFAVSDLILLI